MSLRGRTALRNAVCGDPAEMTSPRRRARSTDADAADRYRKAADLAVEQLDWCIAYLRQIHKNEIARALQRNRTTIVGRYRD